MVERYRFVLVHGAGSYGAHWDAVKFQLEGMGHTAHAPTLAGHGPDRDPNATLADAVTSLSDYFNQNNLTDVVLVGLSLGGVFMSQALPDIADRVRRVVFHNAVVAENGNSAADELSPGVTLPTPEYLPPFENARERFFNDVSKVQAQYFYNMMIPELTVMFTTVLDQTGFEAIVADGSVPMSYVSFDGDMAVPPGEATGWYPRFANRLGPNVRIVPKPGGSHGVLLSDPRRVAETYVEAGRD